MGIPDSVKTDGVDDSGVGASPVDLLSVNLTGGMELEFVRPHMVQTGHCIRLWSLNFPEMAMRHAGELMWNHRIADDHLAILDSSFCVKSGLASSGSEWLSLEAENYPGVYVRHRGFRLEISRYDGSSLFRSDATWRMVAPLDAHSPGYGSLEMGESWIQTLHRNEPTDQHSRRSKNGWFNQGIYGLRGWISPRHNWIISCGINEPGG